jgi:hypothetical protein
VRVHWPNVFAEINSVKAIVKQMTERSFLLMIPKLVE